MILEWARRLKEKNLSLSRVPLKADGEKRIWGERQRGTVDKCNPIGYTSIK